MTCVEIMLNLGPSPGKPSESSKSLSPRKSPRVYPFVLLPLCGCSLPEPLPQIRRIVKTRKRPLLRRAKAVTGCLSHLPRRHLPSPTGLLTTVAAVSRRHLPPPTSFLPAAAADPATLVLVACAVCLPRHSVPAAASWHHFLDCPIGPTGCLPAVYFCTLCLGNLLPTAAGTSAVAGWGPPGRPPIFHRSVQFRDSPSMVLSLQGLRR